MVSDSAAKSGSDASHPAVHLPFYEAAKLSRARLAFCSAGELSETARRRLSRIRPRSLEQLVYQGLVHLQMARGAQRMAPTDALIVLEFNPLYMLLAAPLLMRRKTKVLLVLHGAQQFAMVSLGHLLGLRYTRLFGFGFIQFEVAQDVPPRQVRIPPTRCLVIPHPLDVRCRPRMKPGERLGQGATLRVGMAGMFRKGKPMLEIARQVKALLDRAHPDCELVLGTPSWQDDGRLDALGVTVVDTTSPEGYIDFLRSLDVSVHDFDAELYFYRPSGTIADAIACGCHVVCPDFPLFRNQILNPARVGTAFGSREGLDDAVAEAIAWAREHGQDGQWTHHAVRSPTLLAALLDGFVLGDPVPTSAWRPLPLSEAPAAPEFKRRAFVRGY